MSDEFIYVGARPSKAWADFRWARVASSRTAVSEMLSGLDGRKRAFLVVSERAGWQWILGSIAAERSSRRWQSRILGLADVEHGWAVESVLDAHFDRWIRRPPVMLPLEALIEVLESPRRSDLCIGGAVDRAHGVVALVRGDLDVLSVPVTTFRPSGRGTTAAFDDFEIIDHGQTLRFGDYEASFDAILYEHDEQYRRAVHRQRRAEDTSFGASLQRLRLQRGLARDAFPGVSAKAIARIERGEVAKPHAATLRKIAETLGVKAEEIASY